MTQRQMGFWNPFWFECKAAAYSALNSARKTGSDFCESGGVAANSRAPSRPSRPTSKLLPGSGERPNA